MADEDVPQDNPNSSIPQEGQLHPALAAVRNLFTTPESSGWADNIVGQIQQHLNAIKVADANQAAGHAFVQGIASVKDNLIQMAKADPSSAEFAIRLAPQLLNGSLQHMPPDQAEGVHTQLTGHIQQEVARAAVTSMAGAHADGARNLMGSLSDHLADGDQAALGSYINAMEAAREADHGAQANQLADQNARASSLATYQQGNQLLDPRTEEVRFPPNYMSGVVSNPTIGPDDKHALYTGYNNLRANGDAPSSNPHVVTSLLSNLDNVKPIDIMNQVGTNLTYADAQMLHGLTTTRTPEMQNAAQQLSDVMNSARDELTATGSRAGNAAFGRFTSWLLPAYRRTGPGGLNPASENYLFQTATPGMFQPQSQDVVPPPPESRMPLGQIFAQAGQSNPAQVPSSAADRLDSLRQENEQDIAPASGNMFQRLLQQQTPEPQGQG